MGKKNKNKNKKKKVCAAFLFFFSSFLRARVDRGMTANKRDERDSETERGGRERERREERRFSSSSSSSRPRSLLVPSGLFLREVQVNQVVASALL